MKWGAAQNVFARSPTAPTRRRVSRAHSERQIENEDGTSGIVYRTHKQNFHIVERAVRKARTLFSFGLFSFWLMMKSPDQLRLRQDVPFHRVLEVFLPRIRL